MHHLIYSCPPLRTTTTDTAPPTEHAHTYVSPPTHTLTLHQLFLEGQVLPRIYLISRQLINIDAHVHPGASTHTQRLGVFVCVLRGDQQHNSSRGSACWLLGCAVHGYKRVQTRVAFPKGGH